MQGLNLCKLFWYDTTLMNKKELACKILTTSKSYKIPSPPPNVKARRNTRKYDKKLSTFLAQQCNIKSAYYAE